MERYSNNIVINLLKNYTALTSTSEDMIVAKLDLDKALRSLDNYSKRLYSAVTTVYITHNSIELEAKLQGVSVRQIDRRLKDAIHLLTLFMNGDFFYEPIRRIK